MKKKQRKVEKPARPAPPPRRRIWPWALAAAATLAVTFQVYAPAVNGPFLFDDPYLPFMRPGMAEQPLWQWIAGVRPLLMFTFWINHRLAGVQPFSYHVLNLLLHFLTGALVFVIARKLLERVQVQGAAREILAGFAGGLFLLHPVQTESVAYVASRSEALSVMLFYAAVALFLYRRQEAISWRVAAGVLVLYAAAVTTKEHTAVLVALLLLTDYFWNPGFSLQGIRRNWRLYVPIAGGAVLAFVFVWNVLRGAITAGFGLKGIAWHQYFFTQCRAIWVYIRLFLLPVGQNLDYDFAISRGILERGALFGLLALVTATAAAIVFRRRYPLAAYGWLAFLLLLAPTSSFVPIADPIAERRAYLALPGLAFIALEFLRRWKVSRTALAGALGSILVVLSVAAWDRNYVWSSAVALWTDVVAKAPNKVRPRLQLAYAYQFELGRCREAAAEYAKIPALMKPDYQLMVNWGLALDCAGDSAAALEKLSQAASLEKSAHVYSEIGRIHFKVQQWNEALAAFDTAEKLDPNYDMTFAYRGDLYARTAGPQQAAREYRRALAINPNNQVAREHLKAVEQIQVRPGFDR